MSPAPGDPVFWQIQMAWTLLVDVSAKLDGNRFSGFWLEDFLKFSI